MAKQSKLGRNYELAARVELLPHYALVGAREIAAISGYAEATISQRKVALPRPAICTRRKVLWRLGEILEWMDRLGRREVRSGGK